MKSCVQMHRYLQHMYTYEYMHILPNIFILVYLINQRILYLYIKTFFTHTHARVPDQKNAPTAYGRRVRNPNLYPLTFNTSHVEASFLEV